MTLGIKIGVDATGALPTIKRVEDGLSAAEKKAKELSREMTAGFRQMTPAMASMADAIALEARMLERATGKAKDFGFQLAALQKLHRNGKLTGDEYINTLQKMGVKFDDVANAATRAANAQRAAQTIGISAPTGGGFAAAGGIASSIGDAVTGGAIGGAVIGIGSQVSEWEDQARALEDRMTSLTNRATKFTDGTRDVNDVLAQQTELAFSLNSTADKTIGVYDAISDATERLGLSAGETARVTETVGKAAQLGGKSMEGAADIMQQLSVAFELGANKGGTLRKLFIQFPDLAKQLNAGLGLTNEEIIRFADDGTLGFEKFTRGLIANTNQIDTQHGKIKKSNAETMAQFTEGFERATVAGESFFEATVRGANAATPKLKSTADAIREIAQAMARTANPDAGFSLVSLNPTSFNRGQRTSADDPIKSIAFSMVQERKLEVNNAREQLAALDSVKNSVADYAGKRQRLLAIINDTDSSLKKEKESHLDINAVVRAGADAWDAQFKAKQRALHEFDDQAGLDQQMENEKAHQDAMSAITGAEDDVSQRAGEILAKQREDMTKHYDDLAAKAEEAARRTEEAWAAGLGQVAGNFIEMARKGEASFAEMTEAMLRDLALLAIRQAALSMGGPYGAFIGAAAGALGGGEHGFDHVIGRGAADYPGFAHGGDGLIRGHGGTDQTFVGFMGTPGESLHVRTPQQRMAEAAWTQQAASAMRGSGRQGDVRTTVLVQNNPREVTAALGTYEGRRSIARVSRDFRGSRSG